MKVAFLTLGCKVNQNDSQGLAALFQAQGFQITREAEADIYVVNTCCVTGTAEAKSRQAIRRAIAANPAAVVVVTGCYAQTKGDQAIKIPGVALVIGMAERPRMVELVAGFLRQKRQYIAVSPLEAHQGWIELPGRDGADRTRPYLKIEEGCEDFCSYCIVPYARGKVRSMPVEKVVGEFKRLLDQGYREIVLTGIHLGSYGRDLGLTLNFILEQLLGVHGVFRIRLGSIEPNDIDDRFIAGIATHPKMCQYLHIPLQSGSDHILRLMNRPYARGYFEDLIIRLRSKNPHLAIGTDLIVGFPGETEADFNETSHFIARLAFSRMHVFRFSARDGTPAAALPDRVPAKLKEERSRIIQKIAIQNGRDYARSFLGKEVTVLFEKRKADFWTGLSSEYLRVNVAANDGLKNCMIPVKITQVREEQLFGTVTVKDHCR